MWFWDLWFVLPPCLPQRASDPILHRPWLPLCGLLINQYQLARAPFCYPPLQAQIAAKEESLPAGKSIETLGNLRSGDFTSTIQVGPGNELRSCGCLVGQPVSSHLSSSRQLGAPQSCAHACLSTHFLEFPSLELLEIVSLVGCSGWISLHFVWSFRRELHTSVARREIFA